MLKDLGEKLDLLNKLLNDSGVIDVVLFGSYVKGKSIPKDIDVLVIFHDAVPSEKLIDVEVKLSDEGLDAVCIHYSHLLKEQHLFSSILLEGISLRSGNRFFESAGMISLVFFIYKHELSSTDRVRFYRAIKSLETTDFIGKGIIISEVSESAAVEEIFKRFRIKYIKLPAMIPRSFYEAFKNWCSAGPY
mgnify:CR=1 FL=1